MTQRDGGKGDRKRPLVIPEKQFNANWDSIFGNKPTPLADKVVKQIEEAIKNDSIRGAGS
jgi:hypothetical protein